MLISNFVTKKELYEYIEANYGKILFIFSVWHHLESGDDYGYVINNKENQRFLLLSKDDKLCVSNESELELKIAEYTKAVSETKKALWLLSQSKQ